MPDLRASFYRELAARVTGLNEYLPQWEFTPVQQTLRESLADEALFGGAAGGGKSAGLLTIGRLDHKRVLAVRVQLTDVKKTLVEKAIEIFGHANRYYNRSDFVWRWPDGHVFQFGHVKSSRSDKSGNLSTDYDAVVADELTEMTLHEYLNLRRSLRTGRTGQRTRSMAATNPGGLGNDWVMERWAAWIDDAHPKPAKPGELRWYARLGDKDTEVHGPHPIMYRGERILPLSRTFIPARVRDNPHIDPQYIANLQALPEPFRSQQLYGDWKIGLIEDANQVIPRKWLRAAMNRWKPREGRLGPAEIGLDVAAGGSAQTVAARRYFNWWAELQKVPGALTPLGSDVLMLVLQDLLAGGTANVDAIGVGLATIQAARDAGLEPRMRPIKFGDGSPDLDRSRTMGFANVRASGFWQLRELLDPDRELEPGEELPEIPPDPELFTDLTAPKFKLQGGRILIEKKDDVAKRIGRSPDCGDAVVLSCSAPRGFDMERYSRTLLAGDQG